MQASERSSRGRALIEGPHLLAEALAAGVQVETVFTDGPVELPPEAAVEVLTVSERVLARLATTQHARGPVAVVVVPDLNRTISTPSIVLWEVGDPGNLGTALRSAVAFGVGVAIGPGCVDPWNPKVLRAASGAHFRGTIVHAPTLTVAEMRRQGCRATAAVPSGGKTIGDLAPVDDMAVLIGAEGPGLPAELVAACDERVSIPMVAGAESLNAGVAAAVLAYELGLRKGGLGGSTAD